MHSFFRTTFALPTSFDFALYMREASDSYILSLVDVEASTWVILLVVCFVNLGRVKLWKVIFCNVLSTLQNYCIGRRVAFLALRATLACIVCCNVDNRRFRRNFREELVLGGGGRGGGRGANKLRQMDLE